MVLHACVLCVCTSNMCSLCLSWYCLERVTWLKIDNGFELPWRKGCLVKTTTTPPPQLLHFVDAKIIICYIPRECVFKCSLVLILCSWLIISSGLTGMRKDMPGSVRRSDSVQRIGKNLTPGFSKNRVNLTYLYLLPLTSCFFSFND